MGIRFLCPNGHQLHVKAYLAGQRGICPECNVRVQIPAGKGSSAPGTKAANSAAVSEAAESVSSILQQAPQARGPILGEQGHPEKPNLLQPDLPASIGPVGASAEGSAISDSIVIQTVSPPPKDPPPVVAAPPTPPASPDSSAATKAVWYVRPPGGGQFGPADTQTFSRWMHEKRVVADSYVWCDGWPDWQRAGDIADQLPGKLDRLGGESASAAEGAMPVVDTDVDKKPMESSAVNSLRKSRQRTQRFQIGVAIVLLIAVLALLGILIQVMTHNPPPKSHRGGVVQVDQSAPSPNFAPLICQSQITFSNPKTIPRRKPWGS